MSEITQKNSSFLNLWISNPFFLSLTAIGKHLSQLTAHIPCSQSIENCLAPPSFEKAYLGNFKKKQRFGTSLVAQWLRIHLPMQGTWVPALVQKDPTCHRATKPTHHNYWAHVPQLLKPAHLEPVLHNKRSHRNEKPVHCNEE